MDLIIKGCFFPYGKDVMGSKLFVFRGKLHNKATNQEELRRCIIYWFERIERYGDIFKWFSFYLHKMCLVTKKK